MSAVAELRERYHELGRVILCDNGSTDATATLAAEHGAIVVSEKQPGYGAACLAGLNYLRHDGPPEVVAFLDADLADDPANLPRLCDPILTGEADLVLASRQALAEPGALDAHQRFGNRLATGLLRIGTGHRFEDVGPFRGIRWDSLRSLDMRDRTWGWTVEMQFKAARAGLRIREIDLPYRRRHSGSSKISGSIIGSARAGTKIISTLTRLWLTSR